jgi:anthranilate phosphoribosyltransferase
MIGVYSLEMGRVYHYILQQTDKQYVILFSLDGYDEISLTGDTRIFRPMGERNYTAEELGKRMVHPEDIYGGATPADATRLFVRILKGEGTWAQSSVVLANAAVGLHCLGFSESYEDCYQAAVESLESGRAHGVLEKLIACQP